VRTTPLREGQVLEGGGLIGQTLSHYRITAAIGAGGMGEVYRATDTALGRDVAIKVLPPEVAQDPERLARFEREAHLLASLNHPNIAAIYGLEEVGEKTFLALELVEGEDLKERLARGAIPLDEALEIAEQIAEALDEAHNKGIVHRDLKPANVKLTPDGKVKVLDFGLAKAWGGDAGSGGSSIDLSQSPTLARTGTLAGVILGTAAYMSPEQASGKGVDKRADIWSFGVVLFEMLTGQSLFSGETASEVMASVIKEEPAWDRLPADCPPAVTRLLRRCLRKRPRERIQDIGDARLEIEEIRAGTALETGGASADVEEVRRSERRGRSRERWIWAVALVVAAGLAALGARFYFTQAPEARPPAHFVLDTPEDLVFWNWSPVAVSPDGRHVAFVALSPGGDRQMWIRSLDSPEARALPGTVGADGGHFWSPDSTAIAFAAEGELRKLTLSGGTTLRLCALPAAFDGGTWNAEGTIVFAAGGPSARLYTVPQTGGEARPLTTRDESRGETSHHWPQFLPDGRRLLFGVGGGEDAGLHVLSLEVPGQRRRILPETARFQFVAPASLLFVRDGVLLVQRVDPRELVPRGEAIPIASSVAGFNQIPAWGWFSSSATGRVAWLSGQSGDARLEWVDREGRSLGTLGEPSRYGQIVLSPDGKRVAAEITSGDGQFDLWVIDVARGVPSRLTTDAASERDPVWSPDGQEIVFSSDARGDQDLLRKGLQGSEPAAPLPGEIGRSSGERDIAKEWCPEENTLLYKTVGAEGAALWALSLDGAGPPELLAKGFGVDHPHVSPDGRWLAYISNESGRYEVYVVPFRRRGERVRVSTDGGGQPHWRGDGKELFFLSLDGGLMAVDVRAEETGLTVGIPSTLIPVRDLRAIVQGPDFTDWGLSSDGQRFLVKRSIESRRERLHVLLDWPSLLK
jgi:Tol biopolymer transport system component